MRYYFDVTNGHHLIDPSGLDFDDNRQAIAAAEAIARQIAEDASPKQIRYVVVLNSDRERVGKAAVPLKELGSVLD